MSFVRAGVSVWLALTLTFVLLRVLPGDAFQAQSAEAGLSDTITDTRRQELGLDRPLIEQYLTFLGQLIRGDLGVSLTTGETVWSVLSARSSGTLALATFALSLSIIIGLCLGALGGREFSSKTSLVSRRLVDGLIAVPIYVSGTLAVMSGILTGWLGAIVILGFHGAAPIANTLSLALLNEQSRGYLQTAYSKGLSSRRVFWVHRVRPVLHTVMPVLSLQTGFLLGGTVITEAVFAQAGLGQLLLDAVLRRDYPIVQGWVLVMSVCQACIYGGCQMITRWLDPRQRA